MTANQFKDRAVQAGSVFTPTSPIDARQLFAGRDEQVRIIVDVINQKGQHAMLYGERGVGKTSLANILRFFLTSPSRTVLAPRINCDATDTFDRVWRKVFDEIELTLPESSVGFGAKQKNVKTRYSQMLGERPVTPDGVRRALTMLAQQSLPVFIVDEFDRLPTDARRAMADTIKMLSDHAVGATIILVGVADSVEQLLEEHRSVERALVQIRMPRMSTKEIRSILTTGTNELDMTIASMAASRIAKLSQGLPHYAHLLGLYACRAALDQERLEIAAPDVREAVNRAINGAQQSVRTAYDFAVRSPRKDNLFSDVLLACAMAETNELGFFAAQDVRGPMRDITGKRYEIPSFARHLNEFCDDKRGPILTKDGTRRRFRYRFINPLLQPFVIMRGLDNERIEASALD
jgi:energy-coupling factor transporter ATP-binding protein EcfA2